MVAISVAYRGDLRCEAVHGPSGSRLETDAPADNQGKAERFSPTDLVATALATCIATILGILARRRGWDLRGMRLDIEKHMTAEGPRRIAHLPLTIHMPVALPEEDRRAAEQSAQGCPVLRSLHPDIAVEIAFRWPDGER